MRRSKAYLEERENQILQMINGSQTVGVDEIAQRFGISPSTVRKQLNAMHKKGLITRTYGGAEAGWTSSEGGSIIHLEEKTRIAQMARTYIHDGDIIAIGAGTTTTLLATMLRSAANLTVVTNSLHVASETLKNPEIETRICGGIVRVRNGAIVGPQTGDFFKNMLVDKAFISPDSVTLGFGIADLNAFVSFSQRAIISCAKQVFILADHSKIGLDTYTDRIAAFEDVDCLITNREVSQHQLDELGRESAKMEVILA